MERKFKDSGIDWIQKIPETWEVGQLKRLLSFNNGQDYKHIESDSGYPVYCSGGVFYEDGPAETDMFITACNSGLKSQAGSRTASDCGRILHVGNSVIYLHTDKRTTPSLNVDIDNDGVTDYYADVTPVSDGAKTMTSGDTKTLRVSYQGQE